MTKKLFWFCFKVGTRIIVFILWAFFRFGELLFGTFAKWLHDIIKKPLKL